MFRWFLRKKPAQAVHTHTFVRLAQLPNPPREIYDCACGVRVIAWKGFPSDRVHEVAQGTSIENALIIL